MSPEHAAAIEALHQWHLTVPLDHYTAIRKKFSAAGLEINSFDAALGSTTSDEDLIRACEVNQSAGRAFHDVRRDPFGCQTSGADR